MTLGTASGDALILLQARSSGCLGSWRPGLQVLASDSVDMLSFTPYARSDARMWRRICQLSGAVYLLIRYILTGGPPPQDAVVDSRLSLGREVF